ncbi:MAG: RND transporter [Pseudonocardia sp.]
MTDRRTARVGRRMLAVLRPTRRVPATKIVIRTLAVLLVAAFAAGGLAQVRVETGVDSFLPASDPSVARFEELARSFGGDPVVVLLRSEQPRALLDRERVDAVLALEGELSRLADVAAVYGPLSTLNQLAAQSQRLLAELSGRRDGLRVAAVGAARARGESEQAAVAAGEQAVREFDARYGPLLVESLPVGLPTLRNPRFVENVVFNDAGEPKPQWRYVVPDARSLAILVRPREGLSQDGTERLVAAVRAAVAAADLPAAATVSGVPGIVAALGATIDAEIPLVGAVAVVAIGLCLFLVPWTRRRRRLLPLGVTVAATVLTVAVLGWLDRPVSLGVVAFLPVLVGLGSYYPTYFARGARPRVVVVVAAGTAAGFGSLALSPLPFVRDLGVTLAIGIAFAVALGWLLLRRPASRDNRHPESGDPAPRVAEFDTVAGRSGGHPAAAPLRTRVAAVGAAGAVALAGWALLPALALQTNIDDLAAGLPALADAQAVEQVLGSSGELVVVLSGPDVLSPAAWTWMRQAQEAVVTRYADQADPVLSAPGLLGFLGPEPTAAQIRAGLRLLPPYLTGAVVRDDGQVAVASYGVRLDDLDRLRALTDGIRAALPPPPPGFTAELSGLPTVAVRGYELVSGDRYLAGLAGLVVAGGVLLLGLRHRSDGARAVVAAALATGVELFVLWCTATPLNPLTVALGSLTAAVGCEFTVMMSEAVRRGDRSLHVAVGLATLTSAVGFAVLAVSELAVMRQFGVLLAGSVLLSYLAARFVVRALPPTAPPTAPPDPDPAPAGNPPVGSLVGAT